MYINVIIVPEPIAGKNSNFVKFINYAVINKRSFYKTAIIALIWVLTVKSFAYFWLKFVKLKIEEPGALSLILQEEIYLLKSERYLYNAISKQPPVVAEASPVLHFLGKNKSNFLILVYYPDNEFMHDIHRAALENILKRKELGLDDVAIVNLHHHSAVDAETLMAYFSPKKIVIMGSGAFPHGMQKINLNRIEQNDNRATLYSFSFEEMMNDNERKRLFWEQMKTL